MDKKKFSDEIIKSIELGELTTSALELIKTMISEYSDKYKYETEKQKQYVKEVTLDGILKHWERFNPDKGYDPFPYYVQMMKCGFASGWVKAKREKI